MRCTISSPQKTITYSQVTRLQLTTTKGQIEILPGHAEAFFLLKNGEIIFYQKTAPEKHFPVNGGVCYVKDDQITFILGPHSLPSTTANQDRKKKKSSATNNNHWTGR